MLLSQGLSSATNFGAILLAGRSLGTVDFANFALGVFASVVGQGLIRAAILEPVLLLPSGGPAEGVKDRANALLALWVAAIVPATLFALALAQAFGQFALLIAVAIPFLSLHDLVRYSSFALGTPRTAALADLMWGAGLLALALVMTVDTRAQAFVAWSFPAAGAAVILLMVGRYRLVSPKPLLQVGFKGSPLLAADYGLSLLSDIAFVAVVSQLGGTAQAGIYRATIAIFGPINLLQSAARAYSSLTLSRLSGGAGEIRRRALRQGLLLALVSGAYGAGLALLPLKTGQVLLGESWRPVAELARFVAVERSAAGFVTSLAVVLRVTGQRGALVRRRVVQSALYTTAAITGAIAGDAQGAVIGLAVCAPIVIAVWVRPARR